MRSSNMWRVEEWESGRVEAWESGRVESGRVEAWESGRVGDIPLPPRPLASPSPCPPVPAKGSKKR
jgi:hypothetical protein